MTNTKRLQEVIEASGLKKQYIAEKLGITLQCLINKIANKSEFKVSEARMLKDILHMSQEDFIAIFYSNDVE